MTTYKAKDWEDKTEQLNYSNRHLDGLADIFNIQGDCVAVYFYAARKEYVISYNADPVENTRVICDYIVKLLNEGANQKLQACYLIFNKEVTLKSLRKLEQDYTAAGNAGDVKRFVEKIENFRKIKEKKLIKQISSQTSSDLDELFALYEAVLKDEFVIQNIRSYDFLLYPLHNVSKVLWYIGEQQIEVRIKILSNTKQVEVKVKVDDEGLASEKSEKKDFHLHAEINIVYNYPHVFRDTQEDKEYIGISKLCCALCDEILISYEFLHRGTHGYICGDDIFYLDRFEDILKIIRENSRAKIVEILDRKLTRTLSIDNFEGETLKGLKKKLITEETIKQKKDNQNIKGSVEGQGAPELDSSSDDGVTVLPSRLLEAEITSVPILSSYVQIITPTNTSAAAQLTEQTGNIQQSSITIPLYDLQTKAQAVALRVLQSLKAISTQTRIWKEDQVLERGFAEAISASLLDKEDLLKEIMTSEMLEKLLVLNLSQYCYLNSCTKNYQNWKLIKKVKLNAAIVSNEDVTNLINSAYEERVLSGFDTSLFTDIGSINKYWGKYTLDGITKILGLRIDDLALKQDVFILEGRFIDAENNNIPALIKKIVAVDENKIILVPLNLAGKHAVGLVFEKQEGEGCDQKLKVTYIDPSNEGMPQELRDLLYSVSQQINSEIEVIVEELAVESQKYANCGPEVIENFVYYLTGSRVSQEEAIELHSWLIEREIKLYGAQEKGLAEEEGFDIMTTLFESTRYFGGGAENSAIIGAVDFGSFFEFVEYV
jgi:hypothetical protein